MWKLWLFTTSYDLGVWKYKTKQKLQSLIPKGEWHQKNWNFHPSDQYKHYYSFYTKILKSFEYSLMQKKTNWFQNSGVKGLRLL